MVGLPELFVLHGRQVHIVPVDRILSAPGAVAQALESVQRDSQLFREHIPLRPFIGQRAVPVKGLSQKHHQPVHKAVQYPAEHPGHGRQGLQNRRTAQKPVKQPAQSPEQPGQKAQQQRPVQQLLQIQPFRPRIHIFPLSVPQRPADKEQIHQPADSNGYQSAL